MVEEARYLQVEASCIFVIWNASRLTPDDVSASGNGYDKLDAAGSHANLIILYTVLLEKGVVK